MRLKTEKKEHLSCWFNHFIDLNVNRNLGVKTCEIFIKCFQMLVCMLHVINCTHLSYAVHWQLWGTNINCPDPCSTCQNRSNGLSTWHVISNNKVLQYINVILRKCESYVNWVILLIFNVLNRSIIWMLHVIDSTHLSNAHMNASRHQPHINVRNRNQKWVNMLTWTGRLWLAAISRNMKAVTALVAYRWLALC